jgi:large subunit ribosomal protein L28
VFGRGPQPLLVVFPTVMASVCDICGKTPGFGNNISHSHRRSRRRWNPNIQRLRIVVDGTPKRANVCAKCLKANKVRRVG